MNEEWISDKTRFACDGLSDNASIGLYSRRDEAGPANWQALSLAAARLKAAGSKAAAIAGDQACVESMFALKELMAQIDRKISTVVRTDRQ